jgi:ABC-type transport system substrate-binding protein
MKHTKLISLAIASLICAVATHSALHAAQRPRYGGTLRVEMRERVNSMDPRGFDPAASAAPAMERLLGLVFDRLVRIDDRGQAQPSLAASWQHDANFTHWQFQIRGDVKFHDDAKLTAEAAAAALVAQDWPATASAGTVTFTFASPRPNLPVELASGRSFIFHAAQETVFGTGGFRISEWQPQKRVSVIASEEYWAGRPFVDRIEIQLGVAPQQQLVDLELGKADVIEVLPASARRAPQSTGRTISSAPLDLYALLVTPRGSATYNPLFSQALSLSIDRTAIVNVLLQRQGEPAGSLLPQWLSGYAFLFPATVDVSHAREIRAQFSFSPLQTLVYDESDPLAATIAQRIAVNARDVGINLGVSPASVGGAAVSTDVHLVRWRIAAPDGQQALLVMLTRLEFGRVDWTPPVLETPEQRYPAERAALESGRIIPIAFVPEQFGLGPNVRDWMAPRWGGWRLEDVWLDLTPKAETASGGNN